MSIIFGSKKAREVLEVDRYAALFDELEHHIDAIVEIAKEHVGAGRFISDDEFGGMFQYIADSLEDYPAALTAMIENVYEYGKERGMLPDE